MGLFERNDSGRDYRGAPRAPGNRPRGGWDRFEGRAEGGMRRGYDRPYRDDRGGGYGATDFAYRGLDGAWTTAFNRDAHDPQWDWRFAAGSRYDQDLEPPRHGYGRGYDRGYSARGYDRGFRPSPQLGRTHFAGPRRDWRDLGGGVDRCDVEYRGWGPGVSNEPGYPPRDVRGRGWGGL